MLCPLCADEKHHKYNPEDFRDAVVTGLNACEGSFDAANRFLDQQGGKNLEYNRYGETLFDILFCGGSVCMCFFYFFDGNEI